MHKQTDNASAATRFARQEVEELQIQTASDPVLLVFAILRLPVCGPEAGGDGRPRQLRFFVSSFLANYRRCVSAGQVNRACIRHCNAFDATIL